MSKPIGTTNTAKIIKVVNRTKRMGNIIPAHSLDHRPLEDVIKLQCHQMGLGFSDIEELAEWVTDGDPDSEDHWTNIRPY